MRWKPVPANRKQPTTGTYRDWKTEIANDCGEQCVYCAIHESRFGGLANFHVEHYQPKSIPRFAKLINVITNLYLACAICNWFKGNDWPDDPVEDNSRSAYPDPSVCDYNTIFAMPTGTYLIKGTCLAGAYVIERLYLNRPQLIIERRAVAVESRLAQFEAFARQAITQLARHKNPRARQLLVKVGEALIDLNQQFREANKKRPYELADIRRSKR